MAAEPRFGKDTTQRFRPEIVALRRSSARRRPAAEGSSPTVGPPQSQDPLVITGLGTALRSFIRFRSIGRCRLDSPPGCRITPVAAVAQPTDRSPPDQSG